MSRFMCDGCIQLTDEWKRSPNYGRCVICEKEFYVGWIPVMDEHLSKSNASQDKKEGSLCSQDILSASYPDSNLASCSERQSLSDLLTVHEVGIPEGCSSTYVRK